MTKLTQVLAASAVAALIASPALADWDRNQARDPAFDSGADQQKELAAERDAHRNPVAKFLFRGSSVATHDDQAHGKINQKDWFIMDQDRAVGNRDNPHTD